jgi:hypothetical protein
MASRTEFLAELGKQITELGEALNQVTQTVGDNKREIDQLRVERDQQVRRNALALLPNLAPATLSSLERKIGKFVSASEAADLVAKDEQILRARFDRLKGSYDPATYEQQLASIQLKLENANDELTLGRPPYDDLVGIPNLVRLIEAGYGTGSYPYHFWNKQGRIDWKAADEVVEQAKLKDWASVRQAYDNAKRDFDMFKDAVGQLERAKAALENVKGQYDELQKALEGVPEKVLEQLQTKLIASLSSLETGSTSVLDEKIARLQDQNAKLNDSRTRMASDLASLQNVRTRTSRSRSNEVPDKYMGAIRSGGSRGSFGSGIAASSPNFITVYNNGGSFYEGMFWGEMLAESREDRYDRGRSGYGQSDYRTVDRSVET